MTKIVINKEHDSFLIKNSVVRRYFEILAELNPTKKYDYEVKNDGSTSFVIDNLDDYYWGEVTHLLNGEFWWGGEIPRDCPALVRLVEETDGECVRNGQAVIAELPDDVEWEVLSWDGGREEIHEKHRKWVFEPKQNQVVCYDHRERKTEQIDEAILLIDEVTNQLMHANNLLKLNFKGGSSKQIRQSLLALAEVIKEEYTLTKM